MARQTPHLVRGAGALLCLALIGATLVDLRERGIEEAMLGVDAENPTGALALYEGLGFEVKVRTKRYRKPLDS